MVGVAAADRKEAARRRFSSQNAHPAASPRQLRGHDGPDSLTPVEIPVIGTGASFERPRDLDAQLACGGTNWPAWR